MCSCGGCFSGRVQNKNKNCYVIETRRNIFYKLHKDIGKFNVILCAAVVAKPTWNLIRRAVRRLANCHRRAGFRMYMFIYILHSLYKHTECRVCEKTGNKKN